MSFKPQVTTGVDPTFYGNALAFATEAEALANAKDLFERWILCTGHRAIESDEPVSHTYVDGVLAAVKAVDPTPAERQDKWDRLGGLHMP